MVLLTKEFGKAFIFKRIRPGIKSFFMKAGYDDVPYEFFGWLFWVTLAITYLIYMLFVYPKISPYSLISVFVITFITWVVMQITLIALSSVYFYFSLTINIYQRTKEIEKILPDYLQAVSSSLKGGMSFEKSLWTAIKPEFGIIAKEITMVSKKVMTGNDLKEALEEFTQKYDSPILRRSFDLIIGEVESGGKIAHIIDKVIENIRKTKNLKEEMSAATLTYTIFIGSIVILIAPGLFALSYHLMTMMAQFGGKLATTQVGVTPINFSLTNINPGFFKTFSIGALLLISFFSSLIVSVIEKGEIRGGVKYIPMFVISSIVFYLIFLSILGVLFKGMIAL